MKIAKLLLVVVAWLACASLVPPRTSPLRTFDLFYWIENQLQPRVEAVTRSKPTPECVPRRGVACA